jgi:hypothetical protein
MLTITALLLGLAGLLAGSTPLENGPERTTLTCHVAADGSCR